MRAHFYTKGQTKVLAAITIQRYWRGCFHRIKTRRELKEMLKDIGEEELLLTQPEYRRKKAIGVVIRAMGRFAHKMRLLRLRHASALKI